MPSHSHEQQEKVEARLVGENKHKGESFWVFSESIQLSANGLPLEESQSLSESSRQKAPPGKICFANVMLFTQFKPLTLPRACSHKGQV